MVIQCLKKTELANWISPRSVRSYNPARQKRALGYYRPHLRDISLGYLQTK